MTLVCPESILAGAVRFCALLALLLWAGVSATTAGAGVITFTDVTVTAGVAGSAGLGTAAAFGDIDEDEDLDLMVWNVDTDDSHIFRNNGDGTFEDITWTPGYSTLAGSIEGSSGGQITDFDNDGDTDVPTATSGSDATSVGFLLFRRDATGFLEVSQALGLRRPEQQYGAAWADINRDGYLDLYVSPILQFRTWRPYLHMSHLAQSFTDERVERGLNFVSNAATNVWFDWEDDGDPDLFIGSYYGTDMSNRLYRNDGTGHFSWASGAFVATPEVTTGVELGDFDGDQRMDLFVLETVAPNAHSVPPVLNGVWRDNGDGTFTDIAATLNLGMAEYMSPGGTRDIKSRSIVADFDNDMDLDVFVTLDSPVIGREPHSQLWLNEGGVYVERSAEAGIATPGDTNDCTCGDYNSDGFLDIFEVNSGFVGGARHTLYRNNGNSNHWLIIDPVGVASNRDAIGLKAWLTAGGVTQIRELYSTITHPTQLHFGLGSNTAVDSLRLRWPSGHEETYEDLTADQVFRPVEGELVPLPPAGIFLQ